MVRGLPGKEARESRLHQAIANDDVEDLHNLIEEEPELLDCVSKHPFPHTPLHLAAATGKTQVAVEIAILKPSFARKLNSKGDSPMHLALQFEHYQTVRALMTRDPKLIRVPGQHGITALHYVATKEGDDEVELLAEFLCACKSSIEDLTSRCETAVHVAINNHNVKAFKVLVGWLKRMNLTEILNWKDQDGNTVLPIAVFEKQAEIISMVIGHVKVYAKNLQGKTAVQMFKENPSGDRNLARRFRHKELLEKLRAFLVSLYFHKEDLDIRPLPRFLSRKLTLFEWLTIWFGLRDESVRDIILLVCTLVTTATYQAALTPPGGYWQDNSSNPPAHSTIVTANSSRIAVEEPHEAGNIILSGSSLYQFTALNSLIFLSSVCAICITAIPLLPRTLPVYLLMLTLGLSFFATATIELPKSADAEAISMTVIYGSLLAVAWFIPLHSWLSYKIYHCGIDGTRRRVGHFPELKNGK
ncbi:hypothetical protein BT93_D0788 [Corymbia citriodora subsp. variegata]|nr:hypothetical protein BT93_D0788 [Corymbia citriodora subsp. variegata]